MFTVVWSDAAQDALTVEWLNADSTTRRELSASAALLDKHLRANAPRIGESRGHRRLRFVSTGPLGVEFLVSPQDRLVTVVNAWIIPEQTK